ncbi:MAG TPA: CAP domain-containing protein [Acidimicrobiales bacterium]|nr:CAP domain-containing protein [Acidimicrobiales bacterium]
MVTAVALSAAVLGVATPAQAASAEESKVLALTNQVRASVGAPALAWDEGMASIARAWAAKMAANGIISHNPSYTSQITGSWTKASENVGQGPDIDTIHRALVASHSHYVNMTDTEVTAMGVGVVTSGNTVFIVENFVGRAGAPAPKVTTTKAPAPPTTVARPATTVAPKVAAAPKPAPTTTAPPTTVPAPATKAFIDASPWGDLVIDIRPLELATG